eukprot:202363_1
MSKFNYVVTAQAPTIVTHSLTGKFTGKDDLNLIVGKCTHFEIYQMTEDGLELLEDVPVNGRISSMKLYRPKGSERDYLFILLERYRFCILFYHPESRQIQTYQHSLSLEDKPGRPAENGQICVIDRPNRLVAMQLYEGLIKVATIDVESGRPEVINLKKVEETHILAMCFLSGCATPTLLILSQDSKEMRHLNTHEVQMGQKTLVKTDFNSIVSENSAHTLIPIPEPLGGVLVVGEHTVTYCDGVDSKMTHINPCLINCYGQVDDNGTRFIMGDMGGSLYVCVLQVENNEVQKVHFEPIGHTSCASTLSYLDNGVVYVGSIFGDPQLIKLNVERDENDSFIEIMETYPNIGPIVDMAVVDLDRQGQSQVVTCSGAYNDGSLRVIRNGIGIDEQAKIEMPGMKGIWALREKTDAKFDKYLVESFIGDTRILAVSDEGLEEIEIDGFQAAQTVFCSNVINDQIVQITSNCVRLISCSTMKMNSIWEPSSDLDVRINVAHANSVQILVACTGGNLILLGINGTDLKEVAHTTVPKEVSCLNICPLAKDSEGAQFAVVGLWEDISLRMLEIPSLKEIRKEDLGGQIIPRSVLFVNLGGEPTLLCGLGDGNLISWDVNPQSSELSHKKKISMGSQPIAFTSFMSKSEMHVFVSCDRPAVVHRSNGKLLYSNVNLDQVNYMARFDSEAFPDCLAFGLEESLLIGTIDEIQKLDIRDVPLHEKPIRITHCADSHTYCVCTAKCRFEEDHSGESMTHFIRLFDDQTFEVLDSFELENGGYECGCSAISMKFTGDPTAYFVIGTAYAVPDDSDPVKGRILVLKVVEKKFVQVYAHEVKGAVYSFNDFSGKLLAGVNSTVHLFEWTDRGDENRHLKAETKHHSHVLALFLRSRGDFIVVGDLMQSMSLLIYKPMDKTILEIARDYNSNWMTAIEMFDDEVFIGAENSYNLFAVRKNTQAVTDEERSKLDVVGRFHLGDFVNVFRHGSLVMKMPDQDVQMSSGKGEQEDLQFTSFEPKLLFGTQSGRVGVVAPLSETQFEFLRKLEKILQEEIILGCGGIKHAEWRMFCNEQGTKACLNFIDGDLIEQCLLLHPERIAQIAGKMDVTVDFLTKHLDDLSRIK